MKKTKGSFKGKVKGASERKAQEAFSYGYLKLTSGISVFMPEPGKTVTLDFLPYEVTMKNHPDRNDEDDVAQVGDLWYRLPFKSHRNIGAKNDSVVCLASFGKKCPICEYKAKRAKEGADKDELDGLKSSNRYLYVVNPLDSSKFDAGKPHILDISHAMLQKLLDDELKEDSVPEDFMDLTDGVSLKIRFAEKTIGKSKPFAEATKITTVDRKKPYKESFLDQVPKLDDLLNVLTYDELEAKFFELDTEVDDDDEKPVKKKKVVEEEEEDEKPVRKKKVVEEEDDDPPPVRKKKKTVEEEEEPPKKKKVPVKEEPEEEEEEEEEEDKMTWKELQALNEKKLKNYIKANDLDVDPDDFDDDEDGLRKAIAEELEIEIPKQKPAAAKIPKADQCIACGGTGKNSKGGMCVPCHGTGVKQKKAEKEEEEDEKPVKKGKAEQECPSGHRFGKDTDKKDDCDTCDLWDACMEAKKKK